ncbi:NACHT, LRR and PYD domains-containing protein 1b allele 2-like [Hemibagrus wyckioides]|uniref:NACHT, LRR and PYD domains-containing protein 1b allele 2-like n=1 Tax=Hemibagrus wyckioides TaxID=337641 RepID=UPI00266B44E6|nr:NACHT, LRR and PYD domains-containing protein 1b allele 2-like [Hemibagrus wyckioides]
MCKLTKLMFEMDRKGEVLYRIVSWDSCSLDGLGQQQPAGPLYSIACHEGSICHLHLPHCEICTDEVKLTAAHVTGGNVELIQPLKVTNTHVIINNEGLSLFGLLRALIFREYPITAQVLLFYKKINGKHRMRKLHMHLLPGNVPAKEVLKQRLSFTYIETSSKCKLTPGKKYRPCCKNTDHDYVIQPKIEKFECDYGPNYHPTFEMLCNIEVDKVTLGLLDENDQEVWERLVFLTGTDAALPKSDTTDADFMDQYREKLIQTVSAVMEIADCLKSKKMISDEKYNRLHAESTSRDQMRLLYSSLDAGGRVVKAEAYQVLKETEPYLVEDLSKD